MWTSARAVAGVLVLVAASAASQVDAGRRADAQHGDRAARVSNLIAGFRDRVRRSARPELYAPGARFGFGAVGFGGNDGLAAVPVSSSLASALTAALCPAVLSPAPTARRLIVVFRHPADAARFEAAGGVRLLDSLSADVRVYEREGG